MKSWNVARQDEEVVCKLSKDLGVSNVIAELLVKRGIKDYNSAKDFFRPNLKNTHNPFLMKNMDIAVKRINQAKKNKESILVYGDYDVDGTTSVAMMFLFLSSHEISSKYYCPDRYSEGYGISKAGIDFALKNNIDLIIALDCGIRDIDNIDYARKNGIDLIVCDHHNPGIELPKANAILNPKQEDCNYPFKDLCGCGVGFKLIEAYHIKNNIDINEAYSYLDLLAVATLADIVPVIDENRVYVFYGLKKMNINASVGLSALIDNMSAKKEITSSDILFGVAPVINAAGRISHAHYAVHLLISKSQEQANQLADELFKLNQERKEIQKSILDEALKKIKYSDAATIVSSASWHKGVVGIVASKLIETYYKPTIVFSENDGFMTGSARSVRDFDIYSIIEECQDLCEKYGGHKYAAGLTIKKENFEEFKNRFNLLVKNKMKDKYFVESISVDCNFDLNTLNNKFFRILKQFSPYGPKNQNPVFCSYNLSLKNPPMLLGNEKQHVKFLIELNEKSVEAIGFNLAHLLNDFDKNKINLCYSITENFWNNRISLQLIIKDFN